jgi:phosphatidylglycerol:prolipoprotein diacylglycerol transferase
MLPVLFHIGSIPVHSFGLLVAVGLLVALILAQNDARYLKISDKKLNNLFILILIAGLFGSRFLYLIISQPSYFIAKPLEFFKLWNGGMVFYGGFLFSIIAVWYFSKKNKINFLDLMDFLIPYLPLAHVFGRIGCFLNGCCYGLPTDLPWGIAITNAQSVTKPLGVPLHPT